MRQLNVAPLVEDVVEHGPHTDLLRRLKSTDSPVILWNAIKNSPPHNCTADTAAAHTLFCTSVIDLLGMVGHTAGVERIGKAYPLFHTKLRASLDSNTLNKLVFVYINMWLERPASENLSRVSFNDFALGLLDEEQAVQLATDLPALNAMPVCVPFDQAIGHQQRQIPAVRTLVTARTRRCYPRTNPPPPTMTPAMKATAEVAGPVAVPIPQDRLLPAWQPLSQTDTPRCCSRPLRSSQTCCGKRSWPRSGCEGGGMATISFGGLASSHAPLTPKQIRGMAHSTTLT